jgi:MFS transporter, PPP family, 3-phenylpropionic acid transporter
MTLMLMRPEMRRSSYLYFVIGLMQAAYLPFAGIVLRDRGLSFEAIGLIGALNSVVALAAGPIWGHLGDAVLGRSTAFRLAVISAAIGVVLFAIGPYAGLPGAALAAFAGAGLVPLLDSIGMEQLARVGGQWGPLRAITSFSYAAMCILSGALVASGGAIVIAPLYAITALVLILGTVGLHTAPALGHGARHAQSEAEAEVERSEIAGPNAEIAVAGDWRDRFGTMTLAFQQSPKLFSFLALSLVANVGAGIFYSYGSFRIQEVGGSAAAVAFGGSVSAAVEIPLFLAGGIIATRLGLRSLFSFGLVAMGVCSVAYAFIDSPYWLAIARSLVGVGFACTLLASVLSVREIVPLALQATGQALYQSVSYGLAVAIAALVGGILYGELGAAPLFLLSAVILFGSIPFAWRVLR